MATRAETERAEQAKLNSASKRPAAKKTSRTAELRAAAAASPKGRAVHGRTKLQADAKAGKPAPKRTAGKRLNGGEEQTTNGVTGTGRGADGPPGPRSRKSTRGGVPAGEKVSSLPRAATRRVTSPEARAARGR